MWKGIAKSSAEGHGLTIPEFKLHVDALDFKSWRPSFMVLHNTAAPTLAQWHQSSAAQRILNLQAYYRDQLGWSGAPHAFVAVDYIWPFTPFTVPGVHTPSWNAISLGIELVGDYAREDDDAGPGLKVKQNGIAVFAILHAKLGLDPRTIRLHKEDKATDHDCPGKDLADDKMQFIAAVETYMTSLGDAGEHPQAIPIMPQPAPAQRQGIVNVTPGDWLNLRADPNAAALIMTRLPVGSQVTILGEASNGTTKWMRVTAANRTGWVAARFVKEA